MWPQWLHWRGLVESSVRRLRGGLTLITLVTRHAAAGARGGHVVVTRGPGVGVWVGRRPATNHSSVLRRGPIRGQYHGVMRTNQRPVSPVSAEVVVATVVGELAHSGGHLQPGAGGQVGNTGRLMGAPYFYRPYITYDRYIDAEQSTNSNHKC